MEDLKVDDQMLKQINEWLDQSGEDYGDHQFWIRLHSELFGSLSDSAGEVRVSEMEDISLSEPDEIWPELMKLEKDLRFWMSEGYMPFPEMAARFYERIQTIHPFDEGNEVFGKVLIEYFCRQEGKESPDWGSRLQDSSKKQVALAAALEQARETGTYDGLIKFMYS